MRPKQSNKPIACSLIRSTGLPPPVSQVRLDCAGMEEETKTPLLVVSTECDKAKALSLSLSQRSVNNNTVTALRSDFFSKLPEKVRSGLDPESPFHVDLSKVTGFIEGKRLPATVLHLHECIALPYSSCFQSD